jgi:protocatechuate 3,4-dioxygenase alpha subunit
MTEPTPSQTVGPYFALGLTTRPAADIVAPGDERAIRLEGRVLDGAGEPVPDAMVEVWLADTGGRYRGDFGWARSGTDANGRYALTIVKPGAVSGQAPHLTMLVFARGLLKPVLTRVYFPDEEDANAGDRVLQGVGDAHSTLVAGALDGGLEFDVRLQGDDQTVFFAV